MTPGKQGRAGFANGFEVSRNGRWTFVADTQHNSMIRVPVKGRDQTVFCLPFTPDKVRWGEDSLLIVSGPVWPKMGAS